MEPHLHLLFNFLTAFFPLFLFFPLTSIYQVFPCFTCLRFPLTRCLFSSCCQTLAAASFFSHTRPQSPLSLSLGLSGCLCSTGSKSLAAACSSPNLPSLCTIALGTKLRPHNSRPARVNSRANTVKAKTHFLLSPTSPAKN